MKVTIKTSDEDLILDSISSIKIKDIFKFIRARYSIPDNKYIILIGENKEINELDVLFQGNELTENEKKTDFRLLILHNYNKSESDENDITGEKKEELVMKMTNAKEPIRLDKQRSMKRDRGYYLGMGSSPLIRLMERSNNLNSVIMPLIEPDDVEVDLFSDFLDSSFIPSRRYLNFYQEEPRNDNERGVYPIIRNRPIVRREVAFEPNAESVQRLIEMGFPENRARVALRMTRDNLLRATELLVNSPEELFNDDNSNVRNIQIQTGQNEANSGSEGNQENLHNLGMAYNDEEGEEDEVEEAINELNDRGRSLINNLNYISNFNIMNPSSSGLNSNSRSYDNRGIYICYLSFRSVF